MVGERIHNIIIIGSVAFEALMFKFKEYADNSSTDKGEASTEDSLEEEHAYREERGMYREYRRSNL